MPSGVAIGARLHGLRPTPVCLQVGEARALYNIGNVFHAKGKQQLWGCTLEPGELPSEVHDTLQKATGFYE